MKIRRPSASLVISLVALVMAMSGSAIAAVNFASNAGAVDGKSAVSDGAALRIAAGRLVATQRSGDGKGRIRAKYLDLRGVVRGTSSTFGRSFAVIDNQALAPVTIGAVPDIGSVTASCIDENPAVGVADPATTLTFANTSGDAVNLSRTVGNGDPFIAGLPNGTTHTFTIRGSNTFALHLERKGTNYIVNGVVRQDGRGTPAAACLVYGYAIAIPSP
ncbi:MAG: hypothetical protein QOC78_1144 [Solirubrobacteraceae bacterium]|nr:hypothetical protein [Solirubrobacteraceae bacterium]